jgi:hypothetical protein
MWLTGEVVDFDQATPFGSKELPVTSSRGGIGAEGCRCASEAPRHRDIGVGYQRQRRNGPEGPLDQKHATRDYPMHFQRSRGRGYRFRRIRRARMPSASLLS